MTSGRSQPLVALMLLVLAAAILSACSGRKQVPFGLEDAGAPEPQGAEESVDEPHELPVGQTFGANQVEVPIAESTLVLQSGYALAALRVDLDGTEPIDALVISAAPEEVRVQAAYPRGLDVATRQVDSFLVPSHCVGPVAEINQVSASLVVARIDHSCETGKRTNLWLLTVEAQPRVRERITVLPPNDGSTAPIEVEIVVEDRDADGYEDVVANVRINEDAIPLAWLNRPGGFARDPSQPEATLQAIANSAWESLDSDLAGAAKQADAVLEAFVALCRESGAARIGLSGTEGLQCQRSPATARAVAVATTAAIRRGSFVQALETQRWWEQTATEPNEEERARVRAAWRAAKGDGSAVWRTIDNEGALASLHFRDDDTLIVDGRSPHTVQISSGTKTQLSEAEIMPPARDPSGRYAVRSVRATCAGFEAEVGPTGGKQTHRVPIERRSGRVPCKTPIDRPASAFEWAVLGWAPQGLVAASGDLLRVVPLDAFARPAGAPIDLSINSPLPSPVRGARITPDGSRYVIPHAEGIVVRDWRQGGAGLWLRPEGWDAVPGAIRAIALSPNGRQIALQKGSEVRLLTW